MKRILISTFSLIVIAGAGVGTYIWQNQRMATLTRQHTADVQRVNQLQSQYAAATAAAVVHTNTWKQFCDQFTPFCFMYPNQWIPADNSLNLPNDKRESVTVTNPTKTLRIVYINPLIKDGGSLSARIITTNNMTVNNVRLAILGIIPVSSGVYQPSYIVLNTDQALNAKPGNDALLLNGSINPRFTVGQYDAISLIGYPTTKITSMAQAKAWFDSIDGKTVLKIIESYAGK